MELSFVHSAMNFNNHWTLNCLSEIKGKSVHYLQGLVSSAAPTQHDFHSQGYVHTFQYIFFIPILLKKGQENKLCRVREG